MLPQAVVVPAHESASVTSTRVAGGAAAMAAHELA